jgi:hypothetical protein
VVIGGPHMAMVDTGATVEIGGVSTADSRGPALRTVASDIAAGAALSDSAVPAAGTKVVGANPY